jgi:carboxypeptidase C (cathepsin A)
MGALGPRRVPMNDGEDRPDEPSIPTPPYRIVDNEYSWLDMTDLVFIDPVTTGYSRPSEGENANQFHGLDEDIRWVGDFIRLYTTKQQRWGSPKFLAGESYGTTRAAGLSGYLQDTHGMNLSGIVLISSVLNFGTISFDDGNDTPYWLFLPTYTATAWYHHRLAPELQKELAGTLKEARAWAGGEYLRALAQGDSLSGGDRDRVAEKLSRFTGLSKEFCLRSNLRINIQYFCKELLRDRGRTVGRLDSRFSGIDEVGVSATPDYDPSYAAIQGPYTAAINRYVRGELNYENDLSYEILTGRVQPWNYGSARNRYANVAETLRSALSKNRDLRVLVACGYYDLATPFFAAEYTVDHLGLDPSLREHVSKAYYECGHMMYIRDADLAKLKHDVAEFYKNALPADPPAGAP